ncbi:ribonuclease Oy-like [Gigantopelta aegis]|uniref:ribonuclease Oy-like n=1 Tax=Gigantopelta aegis TaxID=1735272 RepID=UPI001B888CD3|nr:ribonuclease Oy-like [Gigantopelta aegis]
MVYWFQFLVTAAVLLSCRCQRTATDYDWDYFVFTQEWPTAMCILAREQHNTCVVPPSVTTWTIHGLWPDKKYTKGPLFCNESWPFSPDEIDSIVPQLKIYWPNLFPDTCEDCFWEHEWKRHGTCSTNLKATHNELLYFKAALKLQKKYDLRKLLKENGIVPSESETYRVSFQFEIFL